MHSNKILQKHSHKREISFTSDLFLIKTHLNSKPLFYLFYKKRKKRNIFGILIHVLILFKSRPLAYIIDEQRIKDSYGCLFENMKMIGCLEEVREIMRHLTLLK